MDRSAVAAVHSLRTLNTSGRSLWGPGPKRHSLSRADFFPYRFEILLFNKTAGRGQGWREMAPAARWWGPFQPCCDCPGRPHLQPEGQLVSAARGALWGEGLSSLRHSSLQALSVRVRQLSYLCPFLSPQISLGFWSIDISFLRYLHYGFTGG